MKGWHTSTNEIVALTDRPLFMACDAMHAMDGWYKNTLFDHSTGLIYEADLEGILAASEFLTLCDTLGVDANEYTTDLVCNPTHTEIMNHAATRLLLERDVHGFVYFDYDPRDFSKSLPAIFVLQPLKAIKSWKLFLV